MKKTVLLQAMLATALSVCADTYVWNNLSGGDWATASNWEGGVVPPKDGTATVVIPMKKSSYYIRMDTGVDIYGIQLKAPEEDNGSGGNAVSLNYGSLTLRGGGVVSDTSKYAVGIKFNCPLTLLESQTWQNQSSDEAKDNAKNNNGFAITSTLVADEDVVLTVAGSMPFYPNPTDVTGFQGKILTNCRFKPNTSGFMTKAVAPAMVEIYATDEPYPSAKLERIFFSAATVCDEIKITAPVKLDLADCDRLMRISLQVSSNILSNRWWYNWTGPISGAFKDKLLSFGNVMESSSQHRSHYPHKQRNFLRGDNSGLATAGLPAVCFPNGVFTIANANALGTGNVLGAYFGSGDTAGHFKGLTVTDGITVASQMSLGLTTPTMLGMLDPGEGTFSGDFTGNKQGTVYLTAVPGAKVHFTGAFTMNNYQNYSLEAIGGGEVHLDGDNSKVTYAPLNVRSAKVVLGHANAAGAKPVNLGGVVPSKVTVRAFRDRNWNCGGTGEPTYTMTDVDKGKTNYTFTGSLVVDGVTLNVGDTLLYGPDVADGSSGRIYKLVSSGHIVGEPLPYAAGMKVCVEEGGEYGGSTFMIDNGASACTATSCGAGTPVRDVTDPDAGLFAKNGVTVANDITVVDNLSAGMSMLGVADGSTVTFTGDVTVNRSVTFCGAAGGTAKFTGSFVENGGVKHSIGLTGAGTAEIPDLDWSGRTLDLGNVDPDVLDASGLTNVTLLRAKGVGNATVIQPRNKGKWKVSVYENAVVATKDGTMMFLR